MSRAKVLVVDDEDAIRSTLKMIFEYEGYECVLAANGPAALKIAEREAPDLVFLDIKMPQMDGMEVLKALKEVEGSPPVVILSGHGTVKTAVEATKLGAYDFIEKPPERERILRAVKRAQELGATTASLSGEDRVALLVDDDALHLGGRECVDDELRRVVGPQHDVDALAGELVGHRSHA